MRYQVTGYVVESEPSTAVGARPVSVAVKIIEEKRYQEIKQTRDVCLLAVVLEERLQFVIDNFSEWESELLNQSQTYLLWQTTRHESMQQRLKLDRRLVNVLTAVRLYLDQTDNNISDVFGNPSAELEAIKKFKNDLYDKHFGYRFLEALRNHTQHYGLAVQMLTFNSGFVDGDPKRQVQVSVIPQAMFDELAADKNFKKPILNEIKPLGEKIDLRPLIREYISCIVQLHGAVRNVFSKVISNSREIYSKTIDEYKTIDTQAIRFPKLQSCKDTGEVEEQVDLISDFLSSYEVLHKRNSCLHNISISFVSNAVKPRR